MSEVPLEIDILFECNICFSNHTKMPTKYKCINCTTQICDECFARYIITKKNCVFCRSPLIIDNKDIPIVSSYNSENYTLYISFRKVKTIASGFMGLWICFLLSTTIFFLIFRYFQDSSKSRNSHEKIKNNTDYN